MDKNGIEPLLTVLQTAALPLELLVPFAEEERIEHSALGLTGHYSTTELFFLICRNEWTWTINLYLIRVLLSPLSYVPFLVGMTGVEPVQPGVWDPCTTVMLHPKILEQMDLNHWPRTYQVRALPLSYTPLVLSRGERRNRTFIPALAGTTFSRGVQQASICLLSIFSWHNRSWTCIYRVRSSAFFQLNYVSVSMSAWRDSNSYFRFRRPAFFRWTTSHFVWSPTQPRTENEWLQIICFTDLNYQGKPGAERESRTHCW